MATIRRLSDEDVKTVFQCIHTNTRPPEKLRFQIVVVGPDGLKLSPPSYEFEDGLYILLKPLKKKKNADVALNLNKLDPRIPSKLVDYVMPERTRRVCPWSLSGPQFPQPTAIQQRYCYPKGDPTYSSQKGGALWTTYCDNGKEDLEYRLLHVYFSAKRAVNKGVSVPDSVRVADPMPTPGKRSKRSPVGKRNHKTSSPPSALAVSSPVSASAGSPSVCASPLSFDLPPPPPAPCPPSPRDIAPPGIRTHHSPIRRTRAREDGGGRSSDDVDSLGVDIFSDSFHPVHLVDSPNQTFTIGAATAASGTESASAGRPVVVRPLRKSASSSQSHRDATKMANVSPAESSATSPPVTRRCRTSADPANDHAVGGLDIQSLLAGETTQRDGSFSLDPDLLDCDSWSDPIPVTNPQEFPVQNARSALPSLEQGRQANKSFATRLNRIHETIKDEILGCAGSNGAVGAERQGQLLGIFASWAKKVAQSPLGEVSAGICPMEVDAPKETGSKDDLLAEALTQSPLLLLASPTAAKSSPVGTASTSRGDATGGVQDVVQRCAI